jgi:hypothetical protein
MKKIMLPLLCLLTIFISACDAKPANSNQITPSLTSAPTISVNQTVAPTSTPSRTPTITPTPQPQHSDLYDSFKEKVGSEITIEDGRKIKIEITDGTTVYPQNTAVLFDDSELMCTVEGIRTVDPLSNKRYIMIDFSIMNLSSSDFENTEDFLSLSDYSDYTYSPTVYLLDDISAPIGTLNMVIKPGDIARGEVTFEVPYKSSSNLTLRYDIPGDKIGRALFDIDLSTAVNQNGIKSSSIK